jgi:hypothetical protein
MQMPGDKNNDISSFKNNRMQKENIAAGPLIPGILTSEPVAVLCHWKAI